MNQFKKQGAGGKPPSVPGLNLFKNIPNLIGQKRPMKVEPLNLLGNFKKMEKKELSQSSSSSLSEEPKDVIKKEVIEESPEETPSVDQSGIIQRVSESDNYYHFSSTKAATAVGGDSENSREFKLVKQDKFLENRESPR
jgi:hypothetical protein